MDDFYLFEKSRRLICAPGAALLLICPVQAAAEDALGETPDRKAADPAIEDVIRELPETRIYRTRAEQREAGLKREITPWLTLSGLAEAELAYDDYSLERGRDDASDRNDSATLQLGLTLDLFTLAEAETVLEYDTDTNKVVVDEAFVTFENDPWEFSLGRQYTPFGVYFSNFVSGPLLEFGETRANRVVALTYGPGDRLDLSVAFYRGEARKLEGNAERWDWVFALDVRMDDGWAVGGSYQSDLADADSQPLGDQNNRYARRVPGVSGYLLWATERFEISLEALVATGSFRELDGDRNRPRAWNAELVHFLGDQNIEVAFRVEGSHELQDEPHIQYGPAVTWRIGKNANLTLEYLRGEFKEGFATNDDGRSYDHVDRFGGKLAIEF